MKALSVAITTALLMNLQGLPAAARSPDVYPLSDPSNEGGWVYNADVSDEFDADALDEDRWYVVGKFVNGKPTYKHPDFPAKKVWKGRAPSQFSGRNHRLEEGKLKLEARWEPDFPFAKEIHQPVFGDALPYENITTPCLIGRKSFKYGYIEIKSKAADAEVTSAFWSMGKMIEFDFFELFGSGRNKGKEHLDQELWWSIRDWQHLNGKPSYTERKDLGFRVADAFHVYGVDWDESGVRYFADGELFSSVTAEEVRAWAKENRDVDEGYDGWVATKPIYLWLDMETFPWHGVPDSKEDLEKNSPDGQKHDGVVDFQVEYVRVWQKGNADQLLSDSETADFLSFEGPISIDGKEKHWWIPDDSRRHLSITDEKAYSGNHSLKVSCDSRLPNRVVAFAPNGSTDLDSGNYTFVMKVWLEPDCDIKTLRVIYQDPWLQIKPFDVSQVEKGRWVTLERTFHRRESSGPDDRPRIVVEPEDVTDGGTLYIDQIQLERTS